MGGIQFYEGIKDFVGEVCIIIAEVVPSCVFDVCMESFNGVEMCSFFWWCNTCMMSLMEPKGCDLSWRFCAELEVRLLW